ncbi:MAG: glutamate--cysteine ligase [Terracoccus sp.]
MQVERVTRTVGVEEEMLLVDIHSGRPRSASGQVLVRSARRQRSEPVDETGRATGAVHGAVEGELQRQQIETHTAPVPDLGALAAEVRLWRGRAIAAARSSGSSVAALGTSPLPVRPEPVESPRYAWIQDRFGLTAREQLTCGLHVHVSVESDEEGVAVLDRTRVWIPVLLALSANSPYWQGNDSGFASFRSQAMSRWPTSGPTDVFGVAAAYHRLVREMTGTGVLLDAGMLYLDARLSHHYPTVEIRAADVCPTIAETVVLAGLCRALVETAAREWRADPRPPVRPYRDGEPAGNALEVPTALVRLASWQAGREGLGGVLLDPLSSRPRPAAEVVGALVDHVRSALVDAGDLEVVRAGLAWVLAHGTGAERQRRMLDHTGRLVDVVAHAVHATAGQDEPS